MPSVIQIIQQAAKERKLLRITYRKLDSNVSERTIEVYEIKANRLWAWDIEKDDNIRQFILSGILKAEITDEEFIPRYPIKI